MTESKRVFHSVGNNGIIRRSMLMKKHVVAIKRVYRRSFKIVVVFKSVNFVTKLVEQKFIVKKILITKFKLKSLYFLNRFFAIKK